MKETTMKGKDGNRLDTVTFVTAKCFEVEWAQEPVQQAESQQAESSCENNSSHVYNGELKDKELQSRWNIWVAGLEVVHRNMLQV